MTSPRLFLAVAVWCAPAAAFAGPRDDLLRLVPDDYTFCLVVQNIREHAKADGQSSFLKGLAESPLVKGYQNTPEAEKLRTAFESILKDLGITPEQLRDDLLGDAVVFAYRKGPPGNEAKEDGLILVHARDGKLLARVVERVNDLQTKGGELKAVEPVAGKDGEYFRRVKSDKQQPAEFYALRGNRLVFSGSEALLQSALAKLATPGDGEPFVARRMQQLGVSDCPVSFLVNPRAFDADLADSAKTGKDAERAFLKEFAGYWKAVDGVALFLNFAPSLELGLAVHARKADLPGPARRFFAEAGKRSPLWDRVPEDALFALVGRFHAESMTAMLGSFLTEQDRRKVLDGVARMSKTFFKPDDLGPVTRGFGPDVGFWVTKPDAASHTWCPQALLAVKLADGPDGRKAELAALKGLDFLARLASLSEKDLSVFEEQQGAVPVTGLTSAGLFPPGFRPCFASKGGYLLVAGSPETIARFEPPKDPPTDAPEVTVLRISVTAWRDYMNAHRHGLVEYLAKVHQTDRAALNPQIDALLPLLDGLDQIEIVQRAGPDRVSLVLRLKDHRK
ncbi:MAG TPA: hypothetical protein VKD90_14840 [Gemmataceae bacterium]|nr:hypothetical protein [Gemmataceae bacterium]